MSPQHVTFTIEGPYDILCGVSVHHTCTAKSRTVSRTASLCGAQMLQLSCQCKRVRGRRPAGWQDSRPLYVTLNTLIL